MNIRISEQEIKLYKELAAFHNMNLSEYVRFVLREAAEDYIDAKDADDAYREHLENPEVISHEDFWKDL